VRGCARPRGGARSRAPPPAPAGGSTGRERELKGGDLGFHLGEKSFYREERNSPLRSQRKERYFYIEALQKLSHYKITLPLSCHLAKARIKMILALHLISPCTPNPSINMYFD